MALIGSVNNWGTIQGQINSANGYLTGVISDAALMGGQVVGMRGLPGDKGDKGDTGDTGNGIQSVTKTSTLGLVDTYTILYTNGTTSTFTVTNGKDGTDGVDGRDGVDGHSPTITTSRAGKTVTILSDGESIGTVEDGTDGQDGNDGQDGADGFSPIANVSKVGDTATISITDENGTTTASISDGQDGQDGQDGADGQDGFSPIANVSKAGDTATITITDENGTTTATVQDGQDAGLIDLGNIDPSDYDDDLEEFLNTLTDNGAYKFVWEDGDDFEYFVEIQSMVENGNGYVLQHYWFSEEGAKYQYNRSAYFEDGECTGSDIDNYLTLSDATNTYAIKNHNHYETSSMAKTVWDYCDDELQFDNGKPYIIYADTLNSKNWLIERYSATRSPNQRYLRLYDLGDASHFFLRSGIYSAGTITWGSWKEYPSGGGGGGASAVIVEYGVTLYADVKDAYDEDAIIICTVDDSGNTVICQLAYYDDANEIFYFAQPQSDGFYLAFIGSDDTWDDSYFQFASTDTATQLRDGLMSALDKQKLDNIESGAEVNVQSDWNQSTNTADDYIKNKPTIPSKTSDLNNDSGFITSPNVVYCTCSTAGGTAAKVATIVSGSLTSLHEGDQAIVRFTNANSVASPTLKIGTTDAKSIRRYGTSAPSTSAATSWNADSPVFFIYDGTYWRMIGWLNTTYSEITEANITNATGSSTGLVTGRRVKKAVETFAPVTSVNGQTGAVTVGGVSDVEVDGTSVVTGGVAEIDLTGKSNVGHTHTTSDITDLDSPVFVAEYGVTSFSDIDDAFNDGKEVLCRYTQTLYGYDYTYCVGSCTQVESSGNVDGYAFFTAPQENVLAIFIDSGDNWDNTETGIVSDVSVNGVLAPVNLGIAEITVPTKTSDLNNDSKFITPSFATSGTSANFVVETYTYTYSNVSSGGVISWTETVTKSGYYPIGCVSFNANRSGLYVDRAEVTNRTSGSCDIWLHARAGIAVNGNTATMDILWIKE